MEPQHVFLAKVGPARRVPQSRIWLEGQRLIDAGFKPGDTLYAVWKKGSLELRGWMPKAVPVGTKSYEVRTVSGKGHKPIIDITGQRVRDTFRGERVRVSFYPGRVVVQEVKEVSTR